MKKINPHLYDDDPELRSLLIAVLKKKRGIGIDLFDLLYVCELDDGRFVVWSKPSDELGGWDKAEEFIFKDAKSAVDCFLDIRRQRQLGFDFERQTPFPAMLHAEKPCDGQLHIHG